MPEVLCGYTGPPSQGLGPLSSRSWIARFSPPTDYSNRQARGIPDPQRKGGVQTPRHSPAQSSGGRGGGTHEPLGELSSQGARWGGRARSTWTPESQRRPEPSFPGETQVKPQSRDSVKSVGTCRTEWVAVRNSGGERTDRHTGVHPGTRTQTAGACP